MVNYDQIYIHSVPEVVDTQKQEEIRKSIVIETLTYRDEPPKLQLNVASSNILQPESGFNTAKSSTLVNKKSMQVKFKFSGSSKYTTL